MGTNRRVATWAVGLLSLFGFRLLHAGVMPIQGTWILDAKNSKNVPDSVKSIDLQIMLKGRELFTQRLFEGAPVGEPTVLVLDGVSREREIAKGTMGAIAGNWKANGKLIEQIVKTRAANLLEVVQTTNVTVTDDGEVMTRVQTTLQAGERNERVMIYRRKH
ncbi:MAG: hypothetical protein ABIT01_05435 [Thermoanaerobaculia bacterium]